MCVGWLCAFSCVLVHFFLVFLCVLVWTGWMSALVKTLLLGETLQSMGHLLQKESPEEVFQSTNGISFECFRTFIYYIFIYYISFLPSRSQFARPCAPGWSRVPWQTNRRRPQIPDPHPETFCTGRTSLPSFLTTRLHWNLKEQTPSSQKKKPVSIEALPIKETPFATATSQLGE